MGIDQLELSGIGTAASGALLGAVAGSFLAAVLIRWPAGESVASGRSRCDRCGASLGVRDLVPILSFLALRGRCRHCGDPIDSRHVAIELAAAAIGLVAFVLFPLPLAAATALLGWWLLLLAALDLEHHWLPDALTWPLAAAGLLLAGLGIGPDLADRAIGLAAGAASLWLLAWLYMRLRGREGLGGGDPKLFGAIGAWLGWQQLPFVLLGAGLAGLLSLLLIRLRGERVHAAMRLPFGTLMALAAWPLWLLVAGGVLRI